MLLAIATIAMMCSKKKQQIKPEINKETMADILLELNIAEQGLVNLSVPSYQLDWQRKEDLNALAKKYKVSDSMIMQSYEYYVTQPQLFYDILSIAIEKSEKIINQDSITHAN